MAEGTGARLDTVDIADGSGWQVDSTDEADIFTKGAVTIEVRYSAEFGKWLKGLRDANAYARIVQCIRRLERGNPGDVKSVGGGLHEARLS